MALRHCPPRAPAFNPVPSYSGQRPVTRPQCRYTTRMKIIDDREIGSLKIVEVWMMTCQAGRASASAKETPPLGSVGPEMLSPGGYSSGGSIPHIGRLVKPLEGHMP